MDPLTIVTTAASIVGTAIKLSKTLYDTVEALKDVPADVRALCSTVDSVKSALSRLVGFMNDGKKCGWPYHWLEDVMNDVDAIGQELKEVQNLVVGWEGGGGPTKTKGGKVKETWRNWKWHFNAEEIQRCTKRLRAAREDLVLQIDVIQVSTTAQTSHDVNAVKDIVGSIRAELAGKTSSNDGRALTAEFHLFAEQISDLREVIRGLIPDATVTVGEPGEERGLSSTDRVVSTRSTAEVRPHALSGRRQSLNSIKSNLSSPGILSPLAALNQQAFLQNQRMPQEYNVGTVALELKLSEMQRKHDELSVHWENALAHIVHLESELDGYVLSGSNDYSGTGGCGNVVAGFGESDEVTSREAVIDVLKAQNEALQDMISERVTIVDYSDENLNARDLGRQLLKKNERLNRQQEEIDLLKWRLKGEQSSLREQLQVNKILDDNVKSMRRATKKDRQNGEKRGWRNLLTPSLGWRPAELGVHSSTPESYRPSVSAVDLSRPQSSSSSSTNGSYWQKSRPLELIETVSGNANLSRGPPVHS
ncbi:hypothetical protein BKA67DRAFT_176964 [Truncatella angustata]|uniref:Fungal N-terminal domain-containing protein n=1 Tax=Truncatella angustata TaxID=152316 RepID=A0A9P8URW6_9PEZI|nr:uncharacterized protein BKA67DRAFT_176964 [Truncatella angustata]KAH6656992.1 hypothetical protein BKA67DRAFT_176964 [Truncatella angustata]KAH8202725.1 hypothetical protein TruAng_003101 [Truncatella angustata]